AMGISDVHVIDPVKDADAFQESIRSSLANNELSLIIARRPCILAIGKIKEYEAASPAGCSCQKSSKEGEQ
ncbi:thiamine pyrophosphate-binding protein, partial [bacterium]|nr:thiamine pyrophosphate-binding protein [bacterium]